MFSLEVGHGTTEAKWCFQVVGAHDPNVTTASFLRLEPDRGRYEPLYSRFPEESDPETRP